MGKIRGKRELWRLGDQENGGDLAELGQGRPGERDGAK